MTLCRLTTCPQEWGVGGRGDCSMVITWQQQMSFSAVAMSGSDWCVYRSLLSRTDLSHAYCVDSLAGHGSSHTHKSQSRIPWEKGTCHLKSFKNLQFKKFSENRTSVNLALILLTCFHCIMRFTDVTKCDIKKQTKWEPTGWKWWVTKYDNDMIQRR